MVSVHTFTVGNADETLRSNWTKFYCKEMDFCWFVCLHDKQNIKTKNIKSKREQTMQAIILMVWIFFNLNHGFVKNQLTIKIYSNPLVLTGTGLYIISKMFDF